MTFRSGDIVSLELKLASIFGPAYAPTYANYAAFVAAGWAVSFWKAGAVLSIQPTISALVPDTANDGTHYLSVTLPQGVCVARIIPPASRTDLYSVYDFQLIVPYADTDTIQATLNATSGTVVTGSTVTTVSDIAFIEGDSFQVQFTVPTSALKIFDLTNKLIYQYADLSDISAAAWTIAAQARYPTENGQIPGAPVAFSFQAAVLDKVNRYVGIGWQTAPSGAVVDDILPSAPTVTVAGNLITGATGGTGGHIYGTNAIVIALTGGGGTGGALAATVVNGQVTGYTVTTAGTGYATPPTAALSIQSDGTILSRSFKFDVQLQPPAGSTYAGAKLSAINGNIVVYRQQTTTP